MRIVALIVVMIGLASSPALAQQRVALVVGNAAYSGGVGPLRNPTRDAASIGTALKARGFDVISVENASRVALLGAVRDYARKLAAGGPDAIGFFYYSGHGTANLDEHRNYLIPVDVHDAASSTLWDESIPLDDITRTITMTARGATNIVVFDACRDALALPRGGKGLGDGNKGLERVVGQDSMLIAFSTSPGAVAADVDASAATGPYATELAQQLRNADADLRTMFDNVKFGVFDRTGRKQLPWVEDGLSRRVYLGAPPALAAGASSAEREGLAWQGALKADSIAGYQAYLASYANGEFALLARANLDRLRTSLPGRTAASTFVRAADLSTLSADQLLRKADYAGKRASIRAAADLGDTVAQLLVGIAIKEHVEREGDYKAAREWLRKASDGGLPSAAAYLAQDYGSSGDKSLEAQAFEIAQRAAAAGDPAGLYQLGVRYAGRQGAPADNAKALSLIEQAAGLGHVDAMTYLYWLYSEGQLGQEPNQVKAMMWLRRAAGQNSNRALLTMAMAIPLWGGPEAEAMPYRLAAARQGNTLAMLEVADRYLSRQPGIPYDPVQAVRWLTIVADREKSGSSETESVRACEQLGKAYETGTGVAANRQTAIEWYKRAGPSYNPTAREAIRRLSTGQ